MNSYESMYFEGARHTLSGLTKSDGVTHLTSDEIDRLLAELNRLNFEEQAIQFHGEFSTRLAGDPSTGKAAYIFWSGITVTVY